MINRDFFFSETKLRLFDGRMSQKQVDGLNAILDEWEKNHAGSDDRWLRPHGDPLPHSQPAKHLSVPDQNSSSPPSPST